MQAGIQRNNPPPTQLVTLLMQTPQLYARNAVRTSVYTHHHHHHHHVTNQAIASMPSTPRPTGAVYTLVYTPLRKGGC
jgi:hypothetical protein